MDLDKYGNCRRSLDLERIPSKYINILTKYDECEKGFSNIIILSSNMKRKSNNVKDHW